MTRSNPETDAIATDAIGQSRRALLDAIGPAPEMTLIRPFGNYGDELIWAGTRELLRGRIYREIGIDQVASSSGELAVISGGGAWSRRYNEMMPEALAIAELRFERVIVLPSSFEVAEDRVRAALERTSATVFARERESFEQIRELCQARLAHDCAFFADFSRYDAPGEGELNAFRVDGERLGIRAIPADNVDISDEAESLDDWLRTIERHAVINTDRAHVMIAAAMLGKAVRYAPGSYFKVEALAEFALGDFDVRPIAGPADPVESAPTPATNATLDSPSRVTIAVLSRDHGEQAVEAIDSVMSDPADKRVLLLDRNSRPRTRAALERMLDRNPQVDFRFSDHDSGEASSVRLATELAKSEYVMFLDDQMQLEPGALEALIDALDADPSASAVAPSVVDEPGSILHCGGWPEVDSQSITVDVTRNDDSTTTGWVPTKGTLFRRSVLDQLPFADDLDLPCQNADWTLRLEEHVPGSLRRCPEARVRTRAGVEAPHGSSLAERALAIRSLPAHGKFFAAHGLLVSNALLDLVPELRDPDGSLNAQAARLLLAVVEARGTDWTLMEWMNGGLELLLERPADIEPELSDAQREHIAWLEARNASLIGIENGGWWKLRGRLRKIIGR
ncbi:MAG: polysaccharide pyruvyl transferase family protein [Solirubrobacterales bacterium]|nr:polysaccharide pyruvyl transferase family protein [Solirubrobacterales bacterium]